MSVIYQNPVEGLVRDDPLPLPPVAPDWDERVKEATLMCRLIDRHLDHEERGRNMQEGERLMPIGLCPEQRVQMVTDAKTITA